MTFVQIKSFITVVDEKSFAKAASILYVSQPAISKNIAKLEEELGFQLLERKNGEISMTPAGKRIYDHFIKTEIDFRNTISEINELNKASTQAIRIGCPDTWNPDRFYDKIIDHFHNNYPNVNVEIKGTRMPDLIGLLKNGNLDFIMTYELYRGVQNGICVQPLLETGCKILYAKKYFHNITSVSDLKDVDFAVFDVDGEKKFQRQFLKNFSQYGYMPKLVTFNRLGSALFYTACGKGVTLVTEWDNIFHSTEYGKLDFPQRATVHLIYLSNSEKPGINLFAKDMEKLFSEEPLLPVVAADGTPAISSSVPQPW